MRLKKCVSIGTWVMVALLCGCFDTITDTAGQSQNTGPSQTQFQPERAFPARQGVKKTGYYAFGGEMQKIEYEEYNGLAVYEGDIILDAKKISTDKTLPKTTGLIVNSENQLWPSGVIPYTFASDVDNTKKNLIKNAISLWESVTNIRFVYKRGQKTYVYFRNYSGCSSEVGYNPWDTERRVRVGGCSSQGNLNHELGHVIGLHHEHQRNDRDDNVIAGRTDSPNYNIIKNAVDHGAFDFKSLMMYPMGALDKKPGGKNWSVNRSYVSPGDIATVEYKYGNPQTAIRTKVNSDEYLDLIRFRTWDVEFKFGKENGRNDFFTYRYNPWSGYAVAGNANNFKVGDFNGDRYIDLIHILSPSYTHVWYNTGLPNLTSWRYSVKTFVPPAKGYWVSSGSDFLSGDFNNDEYDDLIHVVPTTTYVNFWYGQRNYTRNFRISTHSPWAGYSVEGGRHFLAGNWDGKDGTDLIHFVDTKYAVIWMNVKNGGSNASFIYKNFHPLGGNSQYIMGADASEYRVGDFNNDGCDDIIHFRYNWVWYGHRDMISDTRFRKS